MRFNHFSLVEKNLWQKLEELSNIGLPLDTKVTPKSNLKTFLDNIPVNIKSLQATSDKTYLEFQESKQKLTWNIFYNLALQLLEFTAHFDFQIDQAQDFMKKVNLPFITEELNKENIIHAIYLLLNTRTKLGMSLIDNLVSKDFIKVDNNYHFLNDKSLATFDTSNLIKEVVYVESPVDTDFNGEKDLVKLEIIRPVFSGKIPVVMTASPYHLGVNDKANDDALHGMEANLIEKEVEKLVLKDPQIVKSQVNPLIKTLPEAAAETFTHGWSYSLNDYMLARGFASIYVAGIGTRDSDGFMTSGDYQQVASVTAAIDWLNGRSLAYTSHEKTKQVKASWANGRVAMTGKSYLGTLAYGAATTGIEGLEVIVAEAGISSWYDYYRDQGAISSPGGFPGEDLDVLTALTYSKNLDAADYLKNNNFYQKELEKMSKKIDRFTANYNQYWHDRNYLPNIDKVRADVIMVHGLQDWNVKPSHAYNFYQALDPKINKHIILHQGEHIYINNWQSLDFSETINTYFTGKLLDKKELTLKLPKVIWQENNTEQNFHSLGYFGSDDFHKIKLGNTTQSFENHYQPEIFEKYSNNYKDFLADLYNKKANAVSIDFDLTDDLLINGMISLDLSIKIPDTKGILSAQLLEVGDKKRLNSLASILEPKVIDRGHNFNLDDLKELKLAQSSHKIISKGLMNLQNKDGLLITNNFPDNEWIDVHLDLQPTIYQLKKGDKVRLLLYSTDFELTIRDNRKLKYQVDLSKSSLNLAK
jgi:Predicted acyl esterases